ncbi:MAG: AfsR/SARP family transcriptional regulator, partial [Acidimicrobiales bacterium]
MEFRILGSLEVVHHGRALDLGTPQRRALLAMLLLQANQVVAVDVLAEGLWANDPPADPNAALQVQVSRLRKVLAGASEDEPSLITRHKPGYAMCIGADDLDAWRFERLMGDVTGALSGGRPAVASQMLAAALGLWRGPALADFAYAGFAQAEIARLSELRLGAIEALMEARLELGAHRDLVAELEGLVAAHPLRERFWEQRMLALYRCGRQAEALRAYQEVRRLLGDELGIEPSPELTQLEKAILLHQPELDWSPAPLAVGHNHLRSARSPAQPAPLRHRDNLP